MVADRGVKVLPKHPKMTSEIDLSEIDPNLTVNHKYVFAPSKSSQVVTLALYVA